MNPLLTKILIGVGSGAISSLGTWLITRKVYSKKMEETVAQEITKFKADYNKRQFGAKATVKPKLEKVAEKARVEIAEEEFLDILAANKYKPDPERNLAAELQAYQIAQEEAEADDEDEEEPFEEYIWEGSSEDDLQDIREDPYVIDFDDWSASPPGTEQVALIFYDGDEVLADEHGTVIHNPRPIIGSDALDSFGKGSRDANVVYIRNPKTGVDYEIYQNMGTYSEEVHGIRPQRQTHRKMREDD